MKVDEMLKTSIMKGYIIILSTSVERSQDLENLSTTLNSFSEVWEWSIDMTDCDNVLRIETSTNINTSLINKLKSLGIECSLMGVFTRSPKSY
jgi:hypothetical protein